MQIKSSLSVALVAAASFANANEENWYQTNFLTGSTFENMKYPAKLSSLDAPEDQEFAAGFCSSLAAPEDFCGYELAQIKTYTRSDYINNLDWMESEFFYRHRGDHTKTWSCASSPYDGYLYEDESTQLDIDEDESGMQLKSVEAFYRSSSQLKPEALKYTYQSWGEGYWTGPLIDYSVGDTINPNWLSYRFTFPHNEEPSVHNFVAGVKLIYNNGDLSLYNQAKTFSSAEWKFDDVPALNIDLKDY